MIRIAAAALALTLAAPVVSVPVAAEAQVLAGRNAARANSQPPRETREQRLQNRLYEAEDRLIEVESSIAELETAREGGAVLTAAQERRLSQLNQRREREQREVERLNQQLEG